MLKIHSTYFTVLLLRNQISTEYFLFQSRVCFTSQLAQVTFSHEVHLATFRSQFALHLGHDVFLLVFIVNHRRVRRAPDAIPNSTKK